MTSTEDYFKILGAKSEKEAFAFIERAAKELGFSHVTLGIWPHFNLKLDAGYVQSTYSKDWLERYKNSSFLLIDPIVKYCVEHQAPLVWTTSTFKTPAQQALYKEASAFGLKGGITFPIHASMGSMFGMLTISTSDPEKMLLSPVTTLDLAKLSLLRDLGIDAFYPFIVKERSNRQENPLPHLSKREAECLHWLVGGKTSWEISRILKISESGVNFHMSNLRQKFNVGHRSEAVVKALISGLVSPPP